MECQAAIGSIAGVIKILGLKIIGLFLSLPSSDVILRLISRYINCNTILPNRIIHGWTKPNRRRLLLIMVEKYTDECLQGYNRIGTAPMEINPAFFGCYYWWWFFYFLFFLCFFVLMSNCDVYGLIGALYARYLMKIQQSFAFNQRIIIIITTTMMMMFSVCHDH